MSEYHEEILQCYDRAYPRLQLLKKRTVPPGPSVGRTRQHSSGSNWSKGSREDGDPTEDFEDYQDESDHGEDDDSAEVPIEATRECRAFIPELDNMDGFQDWLNEWPPSLLQRYGGIGLLRRFLAQGQSTINSAHLRSTIHIHVSKSLGRVGFIY